MCPAIRPLSFGIFKKYANCVWYVKILQWLRIPLEILTSCCSSPRYVYKKIYRERIVSEYDLVHVGSVTMDSTRLDSISLQAKQYLPSFPLYLSNRRFNLHGLFVYEKPVGPEFLLVNDRKEPLCL